MDAKKETVSQVIKDREKLRERFSEIGNEEKSDKVLHLKKNFLMVNKQDYKILRNGEVKKEIERIEIENIYLKQIVIDLKNENDKLKKSLSDNTDLYRETKN